MKIRNRFGFFVLLLASFSAQAVTLVDKGCEEEVKAILRKSVQFLQTPKGGFATASRPELKKFVTLGHSNGLGIRVQQLLGTSPATKASGLIEVGARDKAPHGKVFRTYTVYTPTANGKERGRVYQVGEEKQVLKGAQGFEPVHFADKVIDPKTGLVREYEKEEIKVRRQGTMQEPYLTAVVDKPGIVMFKDERRRFRERGPHLPPAERESIRQSTLGITRGGKPVNSPEEVDTMMKAYEELYGAVERASGKAPIDSSAVSYVRDAYVYKFRRLDPPGASLDVAKYPVTFDLQHTVDRKIQMTDLVTGDTVTFPANVRANEMKSPLEYAKLMLSGRPEDRQKLIDMGLEDYVKLMEHFENMPVMAIKDPKLAESGFHFIPGRGKHSTGSRLLDSTKAP